MSDPLDNLIASLQITTIKLALQELREAWEKERALAKTRLERAEAEREQDPYLSELQLDHPCCRCGTIIPHDKPTVMCQLPLRVGSFLTNQFITWCDKCWTEHYGSIARVKDMRINKGAA